MPDHTQEEYDAIVVGSGATGGWAAKELTERGLTVLVLEAGPALRASDLGAPTTNAEPWQTRRAIQKRHPACNSDTYHLFVDDIANPFTTPKDRPFDWIRSRQVGGRTLLWGGVTFRMSDYEFKAASLDGFGQDWPVSYRELEPFYDRVETFLGITGSTERIPHLPDGKYVATPQLTAGEQLFKRAVERRWKDRQVIPGRAVARQARTELDPEWTVASSTGSSLAAARNTGRMDLRPSSIVRKILVNTNTAKANGVALVDAQTGQEREVRSKVVILCASTIESIRLLFNSASRQHPEGIGNSSGLLGRYVMDHTKVGIFGTCPGPVPVELGPPVGGSNSIYVPRFRNLSDRHPRFIRGYGMFGAVQRQGMPENTGIALSIHGEQLPVFENRITIDSGTTDAWGIPVAHIDCVHSDNDRHMAADALDCAREMFAEAGFAVTTEVGSLANPGWLIHEIGGARMGEDRKTSVLNRFNQVWDCPNVVVVDGASWVSGGCQNPTLTMMAFTVRACQFVADELERGAL
ncbi:MAG: glucose-methanol-choline oxidoreductase [Myxococcales bacterium]|nr:glucose-methanol-choline oxidoreductase [Myxococcales bacterium]